MFLTNKDMLDLVELRHDLHRHPEISGEEKETARRIRTFLKQAQPDQLCGSRRPWRRRDL